METHEEEVKCVYCAEEKRVYNFNKLKPGDHISLAGAKLKFNAFNKQFAMYKHHALIKALIQRDSDGSSAMVTMIHFIWTPFSELIEIRETTESKTLYNDEIYKHIYRFNTKPKITINRANHMVKQSKKKSYSVLYYNCEHMVRWCIAGTTKSLQIDALGRNVVLCASLIPSFIVQLITTIKTRKAIYWIFNRLTGKSQNANLVAKTAVVTLGCMTFINLLWCIYRTIRFYKKFHQSKLICKICYSQKKWEIWLTFGAFVISNLGFGLLNLLNTKLPSGWFFLGSVIMSVVSMHLAQNTFVALKSPFRGPEVQIEELQELHKGDVIKYYYWKIPHVGIVAKIELNKDEERKANLSIVHYSFPSMTSRRTIINERITIDLTKNKVWRLDFSGYDVHDAGEVIKRATLRIGETKFGFFLNRSSHFCFWAKVVDSIFNNDENIEQNHTQNGQLLRQDLVHGDEELPQVFIDHRKGKLYSTKRYEKRPVRISDEIKPGDLIEIKFNYLFHKVICTDKKVITDSKVTLTYVHYGSSYTVRKDTNDFDLIRDTINIYFCHPVHRYPRNDIINRALNKKEEQRYCIFSRRASHLADEIVSRGDKSEVVAEKVLKGNAIMYRYWGSLHEAIVTGKETKQENKIEFTVIFDGQKHRLATREIITKEFVVESKSVIIKKEFKGYYTYSDSMSVDRAVSRKGEKRFSVFGNKSSEFVHWCKVIQTPFVYSFQPRANNEPIHVVVIPLTGKVFEEPFHENWIKTNEELTKGSILKLEGQFVILEKIEGDSITYVFYNQSLEAVNRVPNFKIDLKNDKERIWIYYCNPNMCRTRDDIIKRITKSFQGEEKVPAVSSAWEFCKWCVLKSNEVSFYKKSIKSQHNLHEGSILKVRNLFGIVTSINDNGVELVCYHQSQKTVNKLSLFEVDFKKKEERNWIYWCTPRICHTREDISERASTCLRSKNEIPAVKSSWEFCKWCVLIENADSFNINFVNKISELQISEGCILKVGDQFGILTSMKDKTIELVSYNQRYVNNKTLELKFDTNGNYSDKKMPIWIYQDGGSTCIARQDIIERASKCLIYKNKNPAVTSAWGFCKWCVLIENLAKFYEHSITQITEFTKGSIVKVKGQYGILNSINGNKIELIFYDQSHQIVKKSEFQFDLQNNNILIYRAASSICHTIDDIIERASKCVERKDKIQAVTSAWEFCKCCVLIENTEPFDIELIERKEVLKHFEGCITKVKDHFGILVSVEDDKIKLVFYDQSKQKVTEKVEQIKLLSIHDDQLDEEIDQIWLYFCDMSTCHTYDDVIKRASNCLTGNFPAVTSAWEFCKWCVLIDNLESFKITLINTTLELANKRGSIIKLTGKFGILKSVQGNLIEVLIYNQNEKAVKNEIIEFNSLRRQTVVLYHFALRTNDTQGIIERAAKYKESSFISEWEFCRRCVMNESPDRFIRMLITTRQGLVNREGTIIEVQGQFGILKSIKGNTIEFVCYNENQNAVIKITLKFEIPFFMKFLWLNNNLDLDTIISNQDMCVLQGDSSTCHTSDDVIERALKYLRKKGEKPPVSSSFEFCKWCVLIENADWFNITLMTSRHRLMFSAGSILRLQGQFGILKSVKGNKIELVFFNQSQKAVIENDFEFDLANKEQPIWIYEASMSIRYRPFDEIIERASKCLKNKDGVSPFTSAWEFCKWCVLVEK